MNLDDTLSKLSRRIFSSLTERDYRILKILAKEGALNQKEIGIRTSRGYTYSGFDRWGVKRRLNKTATSIGLIPCDYVYTIKVNNKETKYALTLKGILAVLKEIEFEKIKAVKDYKKFLRKSNNNETIIEWSIDFIKYEIALILYYNYIRGFDWTRLKTLRSYWHEFKVYGERVIRTYIVDLQNTERDIQESYDTYVHNYLTRFFLLNECTKPIEFFVSRDDDPFYTLNQMPEFRDYVDRWYLYIDMQKIGVPAFDIHSNREDLIQYYDEEFWHEERKEAMKNANQIYANAKHLVEDG